MRFDTHVPVKLKDAYFARHEPEAQHALGRIYWVCIVFLLTVMVVFSIGFGIWEFLKPLSTKEESSVSVGAKKVLSRSDIQKSLDALDARAKNFEKNRLAPSPVKDPS